MALHNSMSAYGSIAKWIHWLTAFLILISYCAIYYRAWFSSSDIESRITAQLHFSIGLSLLAIVFLRIVWRYMTIIPSTITDSALQRYAVKAEHTALYAAIIILPVSGFLSLGNYLTCGKGIIDYFFLIDLTFPKNAEFCSAYSSWLESAEDPAELIHNAIGRWVFPLLLFGHISAALFHHFVKRDNTLYKMTFQNKLNQK